MLRLRLDKLWQTYGPYAVIAAALVADDLINWMWP